MAELIDGVIQIIAVRTSLEHAEEELPRSFRALKGTPTENLTPAILQLAYSSIPVLWQQALELVSLTPDGLRPATVRRFAERAGLIASKERPFPRLAEFAAKSSGELFMDELKALCLSAGSFFGLFRSDTVENFDGSEHPLEFSGKVGRGALWAEDLKTASMDFLHPEVKLFFRKKACERLGERRFQAATRLLAEDALLQMTIGLRHMDNRAYQSIRSWRRMFSAFLHGLQSLPVEFVSSDDVQVSFEGGDDRLLARFGEVGFGVRDLVTIGRPVDFWKYLYAFCYRNLIEDWPKFNLSRMHGLDDLKLDLLRSFDQPWRLSPLVVDRLDAHVHQGLFRDNLEDPGIAALEKDFSIAFSQAQIAAGEHVLKFGAFDDTSPSHLKRRMDMAILTGERKAIRSGQLWLSQKLGSIYQAVEANLADAEKAVSNLLHEGAAFDSSASLPNEASSITLLFEKGKNDGWGPEQFSKISDILNRLAEADAVNGEIALARVKLPHIIAARVDGALPHDPYGYFVRSLVRFNLAEQIRLANFARFPLARNFSASGHPIRQSIRVALKLEREARHRRGDIDKASPVGFGVFAVFARRRSDTLARHLHMYPRERAGLLVLEASMLRMLSTPEDLEDNLRLAMRFIASAEAITLGLSDRARVLRHIAMERAKLSRTLAEHYSRYGEEESAKRLLQHCAFDVKFIERIATSLHHSLWEDFAKIQTEYYKRAKKRIEAELEARKSDRAIPIVAP